MNNAIQSEWALLGGLLLDNSRLAEIDVSAEDFAVSQNAEIFSAIQALVNVGGNADAVTVADHLERLTHRKDWLSIVGKLANNTPGSANVKTYARLVREDATRRRALAVAENLKLGLQEGLEAMLGASEADMQAEIAALQARHQLTVAATLCPEPSLSLEGKEALYRIAQEALHNTVKHARAHRVEVRLTCDGGGVCLEVEDDGIGFDPTVVYPGHLGQQSMRERAERLGGAVIVRSAPGDGACVRALIPYTTAGF